MIVKKEKKQSPIIPILIILLVSYVALKFLTCLDNNDGSFSSEMLSTFSDDVLKFWQPINFTVKNIAISLSCGAFGWAVWETLRLQNKKNMQENTYGSAEWQDSSVLAAKKDKNIQDNIILTKTEQVSKNSRKSGMNRHILVVGRPGTGKSRYFFKPNILNATGSLVITDPKGELLRDCGANLVRQGYSIKVLNLDDMSSSNHYNPFHYLRKKVEMVTDEKTGELVKQERLEEDDVMTLINVIMQNTKSDQIETQTGDPFWEKAEMLYLQSLIYYMMEEYKNDPLQQNFTTILRLIRLSKPNDKGVSELDRYFDDFQDRYGKDHIAVKQYRHFQVSGASPKTMSTIIMTATARLGCFNIEALANLTDYDDMELDRVGMPTNEDDLQHIYDETGHRHGNGKVAYFIVTKPSNSTFNFIGTIMYTQLFQQIEANAKICGGSLATPLDMYMDEFRQQGQIPRFQEELALVRGYNVGITICLQSLSQLKEFYKDTWETVLDCCDTMMLIGSNTKETNEYFSTLLGKKTWYKKSSGRTFSKQGSNSTNWDVVGRELATIDELAKIEKGHCVLFIANIGAFYSELYDVTQHPNYQYCFEPWNKEETAEWKYVHQSPPKQLSENGKILYYFQQVLGKDCKLTVNNKEVSLEELASNTSLDTDDDVSEIFVAKDFI